MKRSGENSWSTMCGRAALSLTVLAPCLALHGCGAPPLEGTADNTAPTEPLFERQGDLVVTTFTDDSASPLHVQVKSCTADTAAEIQSIDCTVDSGYALVGGGAFANYTGLGALLTASRFIDGRTWHGASKDHQAVDVYKLTTYAIGLRLDGVNAATLRGELAHASVTVPPNVAVSAPSLGMGGPPIGTSGGAQANTSGPGQLLTTVKYGAMASKDHIVSSPGTITGSMTGVIGTWGGNTMIEGFGQLDVQFLDGSTQTVGTGVATSTGIVSSGWGIVGFGGSSSFTSGPGRMLFRVGPNGNARSVIAQSKDHLQVSAGSIVSSWTQMRKTPNSHSLCNPGAALATSMDACVNSICASDSFCCNSSWDSVCVGEVTSICGRSCANFSCGSSSYNPSFWNDGGNVQQHNNCYNYSNNHRTDTFAQPGNASGECCNVVDVPTIAKYSQADGLISTTLAAGCGDSRELLAMVIAPSIPDYHWYRRDANGFWTHKPGHTPATNVDNSGVTITNPETANRGPYTIFGGYFCTCSSATEGAGHAVIN